VVLQIRTAKSQEKHQKVRFLSSALKNPGFPRVFRILGQFLWPAVAPMHLGAWRLRRCISRRAAQIESFFESRESPKHWGFACAGLVPIHASGGCRIRTTMGSTEKQLFALWGFLQKARLLIPLGLPASFPHKDSIFVSRSVTLPTAFSRHITFSNELSFHSRTFYRVNCQYLDSCSTLRFKFDT
jgi:hypothetical protein